MVRWRGALLLLLVPAACVIAEIDYTGMACPCPEGFACVADRCAREPAIAASGDGGPSSGEGGADASLDRDVDAGPLFCASVTAALCADFDGPAPLEGFSVSTQAGSVAPTSTEARSGTGALESRVSKLGSGEAGFAVLIRNLRGVSGHVVLAFDAKLTIGPAAGIGRFATFTLGSGYFLGVAPSADGLVIIEDVPDSAGPAPKHSVKAVDWKTGWHHLELDLAPGGSGVEATMRIDGLTVEDHVAVAPGLSTVSVETLVVGWGYVTGPADPLTALVDDLVLTAD